MNSLHPSSFRSRMADLGLAARRLAVLAAAVGLLGAATPAGADEGVEPAPAAAQAAQTTPGASAEQALRLSPFELASLLRDRLAAYTVAPRATTEESAVRSAWRVGLKRKAGRMLARMERIADGRRWDVRGQTPDTWAPNAESTARVLRELAQLFTELTVAEQRVGKARIVKQDVLYFGHVPGRAKRRPTTEAEISGVRTDGSGSPLADLLRRAGGDRVLLADDTPRIELAPARERAGRVGPFASHAGSTRRVRIKIWDREVEQRLKDAKQAKQDLRVAKIRARIDAYTLSLAKDKALVRVLTASLQLAEEMRLADQILQLKDGMAARRAGALLDQMKVSRIDTRRRAFTTAAKFGSAVRRGWMQKRARILRLLEAGAQG